MCIHLCNHNNVLIKSLIDSILQNSTKYKPWTWFIQIDVAKGNEDLENRQALSKVKKKNVFLMEWVDNLAKMAIGVMEFLRGKYSKRFAMTYKVLIY